MFYDRVRFNVATTGTGTITAGAAVSGLFQSLGVVTNGETVDYVITEGNNWEVGRGVVGTSSTTLTRTPLVSSAAANGPITLAGAAECVLTPNAETFTGILKNRMQGMAEMPDAAPAGALEMSAVTIAGKPRLVLSDDTGLPNIVDPISINSSQYICRPGSGGTVIHLGGGLSFSGAISHLGAAGDYWTRKYKSRISGTATAGQAAGWRQSSISEVYRSDGFRARGRISPRTNLAGNQGFWGLSNQSTAPVAGSVLTSATFSKVGWGHDIDTGNLFALCNVAGSAPTFTDLGANFPVSATHAYDWFLAAGPNGNVNWDIRRISLTDGSWEFQAAGTFTANIPLATTGLQRYGYRNNGTTTTAPVFEFLELYAIAN